MSSPNSEAGARGHRKPYVLWLILAICAAPLIASYLAYYVWRPSGHVNYGELLAPRALPDAALERMQGGAFRLSALKTNWVLLSVDHAECDERCRSKLVYMRQLRLAQGRESGRVQLVWIVTDDRNPDPRLLEQHPDLHVVRARTTQLREALPASVSPEAHIYVIDPLENLMMRFPADPDPRRMLKDLSRLMRHSKWK
jgi:cytochrome oxidase Cu insertion factor (SCO1/SenC/PrrC family)